METVKTPFPRLAAGIVIGFGLMLMGLMTVAAILIPIKVMHLNPDPKAYQTAYSLVAGVSAIFALIGNPIGGAISDRSTVAFGRRRIWILLGNLIAAACVMFIYYTNSTMGVVIGWAACQFFFNFSWAAYTALIPDQVEESKRGTMSGIFGILLPLFMTLGMVLIQIMNNATDFAKFTTFTAIGLIGPIISLFLIKEGKVEFVKKADNRSFSEKITKVYPSPKKFPEFTWALASKFLLMLGYCSMFYLTIMLGARMHMNEKQITSTYANIMIFGNIFTIVASLIGGVLSDKIRKQKIFLYISSVILTIGILIYLVPSVKAFYIAAIVCALGGGCFMAVDTALVARVLPNKKDTAKDFGIMNVANCLPQSIVPAIGPLLLAVGSWRFFFIFLAIMPIIGIFTIMPIPEVGHKLKTEREDETIISAKTVTETN